MLFRRHFIWILIICESVLGDHVLKAVNSETTFALMTGSIAPSTTSVIWKHRDNAGLVVKVIEWDREEGSTDIPNAKFKSHATLDKSTGNLNLRDLQLKHSGTYTVNINSKEQRKQYTLTVMEPVSKPYITKECSLGDFPECSLSCEGEAPSESTIIWKYCDGENVQELHQNKRKITVTDNSNPDNHYSCTLKNAVSEETSDPVYVRDLFHDSNTEYIIAIVVSFIILIVVVTVILVIRQMNGYCTARHRRQANSRFFHW
ncbi:hypothetical protein QQF64_001657 [Cirrhinus molitorella]|uniref:Ig-like domain-containing protein n=1 Tax=Cirrhinus molitorella TaxID=172907 RepID=A0ABR3P0P9_9TELE